MTNTSNTFGNLALQLHAKGYSVLPLDGKAPKVPKWPELPITEQRVAQWAAEKPYANIGLRCDQALMVDLDIEDGAEAQRMTELILDQFPGGLIRRRGDNAKLAFLYRRADPDGAYVTAVLRCWMISAVARAMKPGSKVDTMLILEGEQGVGKSTALATLASRPWFLDNLADIGSGKTAEEQLRGKWIVEFAELDAMNKAEATWVKAFLTR